MRRALVLAALVVALVPAASGGTGAAAGAAEPPADGTAAAAAAAVPHERLAGGDRIATAAALSRAAFPAGSRVALLARADAFADALAAGGLAGALDAPVLLSAADHVPGATLAELRRLGAGEVLVLGGPSALGEGVERQLQALGVTTERIGGATRYGTAALLARRAAAATPVGRVDGLRSALLASGERFPDALAAAPLAVAGRLPILLTPRSELPDEAAQAIVDLGIEQVIVLGGESAVARTVEQRTGVRTLRLEGPDRTATAARVGVFAVSRLGFADSEIVLARGDDFPDALAAAPLAGRRRAPLLLAASPAALGGGARDHLLGATGRVRRLTVLGGPAAVSPSVVGEAERAARGIIYVFPVRPASAATYGRAHHDYPATDIFAACGTTVVAPTVGTVHEVSRRDRWDPRVDEGSTRGGLSVSLIGDDGVRYYGSHFAAIDAAVQPGRRLQAGQVLGTVGRTGSARPTPCHLHFGISPPCGSGDWQVRRGVIAPWPYLDAWRSGQHRAPVDEIRAWARAHPGSCPGV